MSAAAVKYVGLFGTVVRHFETLERAKQWTAQVGKSKEAVVEELRP